MASVPLIQSSHSTCFTLMHSYVQVNILQHPLHLFLLLVALLSVRAARPLSVSLTSRTRLQIRGEAGVAYQGLIGGLLPVLHLPAVVVLEHPLLQRLVPWEYLCEQRGWLHWNLNLFQGKELCIPEDLVDSFKLCHLDVVLESQGDQGIPCLDITLHGLVPGLVAIVAGRTCTSLLHPETFHLLSIVILTSK